MAKAALIAPAYLSIAWALMVSYQIFTETAVKTIVDCSALYIPLVGNWLNFRIDMIVFIYAFAWVFVASDIMPKLILGKDRGVTVQFILCLILTLTAFVLIDVLAGYGLDFTNPAVILSNPYMGLFGNVFFAAFYLTLPYIFMVIIDLRSRKKRKEQNEKVKQITADYLNRKSYPDTSDAQQTAAIV